MPGRGLRIGLSAAFLHADPQRALFKGKTLKYVEMQLAQWVMEDGALAYVIPSPSHGRGVSLAGFAQDLDGLVLQGGADVAPESYGETPLRPEWSGDRVRDDYELALVRAFLHEGKPIFGVCRGAQLINVAMGGTLYQDISMQVPASRNHRDWHVYDQNFHHIVVEPQSRLAAIYGLTQAKVCSVHHQGIKDLAPGLVVEARAEDDHVIEAVRHEGEPWIYGVQWHPEWHDPQDGTLLDGRPLFHVFLEAARARKGRAANASVAL
jgi:putative glutamine amidotransferase